MLHRANHYLKFLEKENKRALVALYAAIFLVCFMITLAVTLPVKDQLFNRFFNKEQSYGAVTYPADTTLTNIATPNVSRPEYLSPIIDPTFGTKITRISDQTAFGSSSQYLRHVYAKISPWNSDGSKIMLSYTWPAILLNGSTYAFIRTFDNPSYSVWSNTNPNYIYGVLGNRFVRVDVSGTPQTTTLRTFTGYDSISLGESEGNLSNDDQFVALLSRSGTATYLIVYNIATDTIVSTLDLGGRWPDWASMSQSGNFVVVSWAPDGSSRYQGMEVFNRSLTFLRQIDPQSSHGDLGYNQAGQEVYVSMADGYYPGATVRSVRLDGGGVTVVIDDTPGFRSGHISCRNLERPGWCYFTSYTTTTSMPGYDEIFALKIDSSNTVERFGHMHRTNTLGYDGQAHGTVNRDGSKVMFASDWNMGSSAPVYSYIAEMPASSTPTPTLTPAPTAAPTASGSEITWTNLVNTTVSGDTLTKTGGVADTWDAGATSTQTIASGDGNVQITINDNILNGRMFGLNHNNTTAHHSDIDYAFYFAYGGELEIYENGTQRFTGQSYAVNDTFKVAVDSGVVKYYKNGALVYTSVQTPVYPLFADVSIHSTGGKFVGATLSSAEAATATISVSPASGTLVVNSPTSIAVTVHGGGTAFNAAEVTASVSSRLTVTGLTPGNCNFTYTQTPTTANPSFAGAMLSASSTSCTVYTLSVMPGSVGSGTITLSNGSVKSFASSSEILSSLQSGSYIISAPTATPTNAPTATPTLAPTSVPTSTPVPPTATTVPTSVPPTATPTLTPTPGVVAAPIVTAVASYTYDTSVVLTGTKLSSITAVFVNGSSTGVTYPTSTTWRATVPLTLGSNSIAVFGRNILLQQSGTTTIVVNRNKSSDINGDGLIDLTDISIFGSDWQKSSGFTNPLSDINSDGVVNLTDFSVIARLFGQ